MDLKKELRIIVKYILPKDQHDKDVIENYVDALVLIYEEYTLNKQKMNLEEEFKKEKGRTYWAEGCDYGSYNDDYVNWLKQKLALTIPVVSNHVCKCTKTTQVNKINDSWICTECNRPIQQ